MTSAPTAAHRPLEPVTLGRALPVSALEDDVKGDLLPDQRLVLGTVDHDLVDYAERGDDVDPLVTRNDRGLALDHIDVLIAGHADDETPAAVPRATKQVEVTDMEHVEDATRVSHVVRLVRRCGHGIPSWQRLLGAPV